ncbi:DUF3175 domain-containing protein [Nitrosomonas ureae]|uniref:DUF3175 domain-containing protein n=1 Tax=Nitrosomonas ureae TaxID=44577 RepID=A0A1H2FBZ6_9PROT|nr:DUF3175 domain-containing protein [Nitrosomonas ureae]ALQ51305.1 hypothetical protein ATY38_08775 [Nitrosomonas ureae]SDU04805.1 Protein of unknown function [Nitrosomonas ureae]
MYPETFPHGSQQITKSSHALDLEPGVFIGIDPRKIALSLKHSADSSQGRKAVPFASAMPMLNFYINRAGKHLSVQQREILEKAKDELRELYGK